MDVDSGNPLPDLLIWHPLNLRGAGRRFSRARVRRAGRCALVHAGHKVRCTVQRPHQDALASARQDHHGRHFRCLPVHAGPSGADVPSDAPCGRALRQRAGRWNPAPRARLFGQITPALLRRPSPPRPPPGALPPPRSLRLARRRLHNRQPHQRTRNSRARHNGAAPPPPPPLPPSSGGCAWMALVRTPPF